MHVFETEHHAGHHELCFWFCESASSADVVAQVTTGQQITDEVQIVSILECIVDVDQEGVLQFL